MGSRRSDVCDDRTFNSVAFIAQRVADPDRVIMRFLLLAVVSLAFALPRTSGVAQEVRRELLGIHLAMSKEELRERLNQIATFVRHERKRQEIWKVRDESFSHVIVGFDKDEQLRFVTAVAREDDEAHRVGYGEVGDLKDARQAGDPLINNFNYEWDLQPNERHPRTLVIARGRDSNFLATYTLKKLDGDFVAEANQ